ncbi:hypothetical protein [Streptomyces sp. NPDC101150]
MSVAGSDYFRPHDDSVMRVKALHDRVEAEAKNLYENASLA